MPRRKQTRQTTVKDVQAILRLTDEHGLSVRAVSERLKISKTTVSTYLRASEAGLSRWPLPPGYDDDAALLRLLFRRMGRLPQDLSEPDWALIVRELNRKGLTLTLLWQESRAAHPDGYGCTWFCEHFAAFGRRTSATFRKFSRRGDANRLCRADGADHRFCHRHHPRRPDLCRGAGRLQTDLRLCQLQREAARLDRRPDAGACLLRRSYQGDRLRQPEGWCGQGVVVRADAAAESRATRPRSEARC